MGFRQRIVNMDVILLVATLSLWLLGVVSVYTTSCRLGVLKHGDGLYYLKNHLFFSVIGLLTFIGAITFNIRRLKDKLDPKSSISFILVITAFILLLLVFIPGVGHKAGNAKRWINLIFLKFQPVEFLKFALCIFYANYFSKYARLLSNQKYGIFYPFAILFPFVLMLVLQPDLGTAVILCAWLCCMLFVAGADLRYLFFLGLLLVTLATMFLILTKYNISRILVYFDPWKDPLGKGFQSIHSMYAFALGGLFGRGPGESLEKLFYLPEAHTDYALSVIAEEFGFIIVLSITILYGIIIFRGTKIALGFTDHFRRSLSWGITSIFGMQAVINIGVVTALFPPKGLTLPFISYGGSSLVFSFLMMGILINLSMEKPELFPSNGAPSTLLGEGLGRGRAG